MKFEELTSNAESLLQEIIDHHYKDTDHGNDYWYHRFDGLDYAEDTLLRSTFGELEDAEMISAFWSDNVPSITLLNNGISYFEMKMKKEKHEKAEKRAERIHNDLTNALPTVANALVSAIKNQLLS